MIETPIEELEEFPTAGFRARRWLRFERDLQAWLETPEGRLPPGPPPRTSATTSSLSRMPTTRHASAGILADANSAKREEIVALLTKAYWMEMETVMNYLAISAHLDGVRAEEIAEALAADVDEELGHARRSPAGSRTSTARRPARWTSPPSRATSSRPPTRPTS